MTESSWALGSIGEQEAVEETKYADAMTAPGASSFSWELPETYNETSIVLMTRDPFWIFAYWDINDQQIAQLQDQLGPDIFSQSHKVIRVHEVAGDNNNVIFYSQLQVGDALKWYINVPHSDSAYFTELGLLTPSGDFILLARSNTAQVPRHDVSEVTDEAWAAIEKNNYVKTFLRVKKSYEPGAGSEEWLERQEEDLARRLAGKLNLSSEDKPRA